MSEQSGRVVQERRARSTGTLVRVVELDQETPDGLGWATICVDRGQSRPNVTRRFAVEMATYPEHWCRPCFEASDERIWMTTDEDIDSFFGPARLLIGIPVRPTTTVDDKTEEGK